MYQIRDIGEESRVVVCLEKLIEEIRREGWECGRLASSGVSRSGERGCGDCSES